MFKRLKSKTYRLHFVDGLLTTAVTYMVLFEGIIDVKTYAIIMFVLRMGMAALGMYIRELTTGPVNEK